MSAHDVIDDPGFEEPGDAAALRYPPSQAAWAAVIILTIMAAFAYLDRQILALMASMMKKDIGLSDFEIGLLQGPGFAIAYALAGLPLAYIADRHSRRSIIYAGVTIWSISTAFCGMMRSFGGLMVGRVGVGLGEAALLPTAYSMLSDMFPKSKVSFAISVFTTGVMIGTGAAMAMGGLILSWAAGGLSVPLLGTLAAWQVAFLVAGVPGLFIALLIYLLPEPRRGVVGRDVQQGWRNLFLFMRREKRFYLSHFGAFASIYLLAAANLAWLPSHLERAFGWTPKEVGLVISVLIVGGGIIAIPTMGRVLDWMIGRGIADAHLRLYRLFAPILMMTGIFAYLAPSATIFLIFLVPTLMLMNMSGVAASALQIATPSHFRARVSAIYLFIISFLGMSLGPTIVAAFTQLLFGDEKMLWASMALTHAIFGPIAAVLFWNGMKPMRKLVSDG